MYNTGRQEGMKIFPRVISVCLFPTNESSQKIDPLVLDFRFYTTDKNIYSQRRYHGNNKIETNTTINT